MYKEADDKIAEYPSYREYLLQKKKEDAMQTNDSPNSKTQCWAI